jgi:hypothetical protein
MGLQSLFARSNPFLFPIRRKRPPAWQQQRIRQANAAGTTRCAASGSLPAADRAPLRPMARGLVAALSLPARLGAIAPPSCTVRASARPVGGRGRRRRGLMVVRAGGPPSTNALILALVLPLSLFVGTLVTAARVADDLDERFLREVRSDTC